MMKMKLALIVLFGSVISCTNLKNKETQLENEAILDESNNSVNKSVDVKEELPKGLTLINNSDCNVCHSQSDKLIGPSYLEIAIKYDDTNKDVLVDNIIKGSTGVWGEIIMPAHPNLEEDEVTMMVDYILSIE
jgi:cytochrome c551/c552